MQISYKQFKKILPTLNSSAEIGGEWVENGYPIKFELHYNYGWGERGEHLYLIARPGYTPWEYYEEFFMLEPPVLEFCDKFQCQVFDGISEVNAITQKVINNKFIVIEGYEKIDVCSE